MKPWLDRKQEQQGELVEPVQVIGDQDVVAPPDDVLATFHLEPEAQMEERYGDQADEPVREIGPGADRK
jgi:hypothetical protein